MYNEKFAFTDNPLNRYSIGTKDPLTYNKDGSLDLYIQHDSPGKDKEANWLPAPLGPFVLILRMYWPEGNVLSGKWTPPGVQKMK